MAMDKLKAAMRTSEFWAAIGAAVIAALASSGAVPADLEAEAGSTFATTVIYAILRVVSKVAKAV